MIRIIDTIFPHTKMVWCSKEEAERIRKIAGVRWLKQIGNGGEYTLEIYKRFKVEEVVEKVIDAIGRPAGSTGRPSREETPGGWSARSLPRVDKKIQERK